MTKPITVNARILHAGHGVGIVKTIEYDFRTKAPTRAWVEFSVRGHMTKRAVRVGDCQPFDGPPTAPAGAALRVVG